MNDSFRPKVTLQVDRLTVFLGKKIHFLCGGVSDDDKERLPNAIGRYL